MKFVIAVDLEGCACVTGESKIIINDSKNYEHACKQAVREAKAAANALFDCGAEEVLIWDNHGNSLNLDYAMLPEKSLIMLGTGLEKRWGFLPPDYDAALFIGYHSMGSTLNAVLAHSFRSTYQYVKINGQEYGEINIDAMLLGEIGIPLIFVSSDDKGCIQAKQQVQDIVTVQTKQSLSYNAAISKHPKAVCDEIYDSIKKAYKKFIQGCIKPVKAIAPFDVEIRYCRIEDAQSSVYNGFTRIDAFTANKTYERLGDVISDMV